MSAFRFEEIHIVKVCVIGGGAAGFFGAIAAAEAGHDVIILEAGDQVLAKVRISGGGRCNVTHHCFEPAELVNSYPRGGKALRGPLSRFQPADTVEWFESRGVALKTESDGRMFPTTDDSTTIVDCLTEAATNAGVQVRTGSKVGQLTREGNHFLVGLKAGEELMAERVLLATGGTRAGHALAAELGHHIEPPVPSLFTFKITDERLDGLQGLSADVHCQLVIDAARFRQTGPLLITHWGLSGPAVLKLSAWAARELHDSHYRGTLRVNWLGNVTAETARAMLLECKSSHPRKTIDSERPWPDQLPRRLWKSLVDQSVGSEPTRWAELPKKGLQRLVGQLVGSEFQVNGKGVFKEEFVTCGGIDLKEVDFRSMESRVCAGLHFAGEILDIDGITGGFNFQNAWTTGWIAGTSM